MYETVENMQVIDNGERGITLVFRSGQATFGVNLSQDDVDELAFQLEAHYDRLDPEDDEMED